MIMIGTPDSDATLHHAINHYLKTVSPGKRGGSQEIYRAKPLIDLLGHQQLGKVTTRHIASYRDTRLASPHPRIPGKTLATSTVRLEMALLSHVFTTAIIEWGCEIDNPVLKVKKPKPPAGRTRRLKPSEQKAILWAALNYPNKDLYPVVVLALETAMRQGELLSMRWENIDWKKKTVHLPMTKNGSMRDVPLSIRALDILQRHMQPKQEGRLFSYTSAGIKSSWRFLVRSLGIQDLHFHDLRHEAISVLFEKDLDMLEVATISGHRSLSMLRRYTHLHAFKLVPKLDPGKHKKPKASLRSQFHAYPATKRKMSRCWRVELPDFPYLKVERYDLEEAINHARAALMRELVIMACNNEIAPVASECELVLNRRHQPCEVFMIDPFDQPQGMKGSERPR